MTKVKEVTKNIAVNARAGGIAGVALSFVTILALVALSVLEVFILEPAEITLSETERLAITGFIAAILQQLYDKFKEKGILP